MPPSTRVGGSHRGWISGRSSTPCTCRRTPASTSKRCCVFSCASPTGGADGSALPAELRAAEPRCPSLEELARHLGVTGATRDGPVGDAWQNGYQTIFAPAHDAWSARAEAFRASGAGTRAAEEQDRREATFDRFVACFEQESATTCDRCGGHGVLSCTAARRPWYAVRCDECRNAGWIFASAWQERRHRTQPD